MAFSERVDVQVHGAGWVGMAIASGLRDAGVRVRLVDPAGPRGGASGVAAGIVMGAHPEHPWRFEAALGTAAAADLVAFIQASVNAVPGLDRCGVDWVCAGDDADQAAPSLAASARIGLRAEATPTGFRLHDAGRAVVPIGDVPVHATPTEAEIDVWATGSAVTDPWLADKILPARWQTARVPGLRLDRPRVSRQATVYADDGLVFGARWATPHLEVGETDPHPSDPVHGMLARLVGQDFDRPAEVGVAGIVAESCDGLPIIGPVPGRPRVVVCAGFGIAGLTYGFGAAASVVDGILGRPGFPVPRALQTSRFR